VVWEVEQLVVDGCIPSDLATGTAAEIEEERRLLYVAMTRAKDKLNLIVPQRFYTHHQAHAGDRHVFAGRSRFVPAALAHHFNRTNWPVAARKKAACASFAPKKRPKNWRGQSTAALDAFERE
jgi:DNA helicase-2/ATP-dependent DNA helicase PcrA